MLINEEDKQLFRATIDTHAPIDKDSEYQPSVKARISPFTAYSYIVDAYLTGSEVVSYAKNGISPKLIKRMKRGDINLAPVLDLHGQNIIQACALMSDFVYQHQFCQFIQIIHGKGYHCENNMSVLKTQVASFLHQHPQVLAFNSCPASEGGTGAVFAMLKQ